MRTTQSDSVATTNNQALTRRQELVTLQQDRARQLIEQNRDLLTALNETTVQVANIKDIDSFEMTESLNRLKELSQRAKSYSKS